MQERTETLINTPFEKDVYKGLMDFPKHLSSKYFYDRKGDKLFQDIMNMPEYYLTDCEFEIFNRYKEEMMGLFTMGGSKIDLLELGAGDGQKTKILLRHFVENHLDFIYRPIDISQNVLEQLTATLKDELPNAVVRPLQDTYLRALEKLELDLTRKKIILFLGSNIGNFSHAHAVVFLESLQQIMQNNDLLLIGFDQKKNPATILDAYNDKMGITAAFNKNVLQRINMELDADFDLDAFLHWEVYDPETGMAKSFLVSKKEQEVHIGKLDQMVNFKSWETIHTEISQKYDDELVSWLAAKAGLKIKAQFSDSKGYYKNYVFMKKQ